MASMASMAAMAAIARLIATLAALSGVVACGSPGSSAAGHGAAAEERSASGAAPAATTPEVRLELEVIASYPHDPRAFTQGLLWHQGRLYESTGHVRRARRCARSSSTTGRVLRRLDLDPQQFAEGLALAGDRLFQLTYQSEFGLV